MKKIFSFLAVAAVAALAVIGCSKTPTPTPTPASGGISFSQSEISLYVGDKVTLEVNGLEDGERVSFTENSEKKVITVSSKGVVTAKGEGTAVVTATSKADPARTATLTVKVSAKPADYISITGLEVSPSTLTIKEGEAAALPTATVLPSDATDRDNEITWKSSNESVVKIADGKVSAIAEGSAEVIATIKDSKGTEFSGKCTVTVTSSNIPTTEIVLSPSSLKIRPGTTAEITVSFLPADHTDSPSVTWESSNTSVATVSNGVVTAVAEGQATITAKAGSLSATCAVTVADVELMMNSKTCFFDYTWPEDLSNLDNVSMEIWVLTEGANHNQSIIGIEGAFLVRTESNEWQLICGGNVKSNEEFEEIKLATSYSEDLNKWTHLAVTYSRAGKAYLYVNGVEKASADLVDHGVPMNGIVRSDGTTPQWGLPFTFFIGNACDAGRFVEGSFAFARVWKKALSSDEINANMYKKEVSDADLIASWYFNEGSGNSIVDHSGNGRTITAKTSDKATPKATISETDIEWIEGSLPAVN